MEVRSLGPTGLHVSCVGLGAMPLSISGRPDEAKAVRVIHEALDAGMTFIDTADVYCLDETDYGHNERLVARALADRPGARDAVLVATKGGLRRPGGDWTTDGRPEHLRQACEASLRALETDCIELYQLHAPDPEVPFAESVGALAELQSEGKIRHVGLSNVEIGHVEEARAEATIVSVQNRCNVFDRAAFENGLVAHCEEHGIAFLAHSPVGGHHGRERTPLDPTLGAVAERHGVTPYQVCIAWLLHRSDVMLPIPGASRAESAWSSAAAASLQLRSDDLGELARAFPT